MTREERKAKRLKLKKTIRQWGLTAGERKAKLRRLFPGKSHEEIVLLKRKFQQKLRWERKKAQRAAAKRKATKTIEVNTARNKQRKEARAKYLETFKEKMKDPKFKEAYFKRRDQNIKKTAEEKVERKKRREEEEKLSTERKAKAKAVREEKAAKKKRKKKHSMQREKQQKKRSKNPSKKPKKKLRRRKLKTNSQQEELKISKLKQKEKLKKEKLKNSV